MKVIDLIPPIDSSSLPEPTVMALGFFDGVHRGHQAVITTARREADKRHLPLAAMTFNVHPAVVYQHVPEAEMLYLSTRKRKVELMQALNVDTLYFVHFTPEFACLDPQSFVDRYLVGLNAKVVVAGFDYTYGKRDVANMTTLPTFAKGRFDIVTVPKAEDGGAKISSTRIREALDSGDVDEANQLLGYPYQTTGVVVHGEARGRELGFPTANIDGPEAERLPGIGIYVVRLKVRGRWYAGMASIGRNVTFGEGRAVTNEIYLFDFHDDIYGEPVTVQWLHYLRGEVKFTGAAALVEQLHQDELASRQYLKEG